ncbi:MAG: helix-turn-helix domain-containing protein, partial [Phycisphaeraceae bacterium]
DAPPDAPPDAQPEQAGETGFWWQYKWLIQYVRSGALAQAKGGEAKVAQVLLSYANPQGEAWPDVETIEYYAGLGRRAVQQALKSLSETLIERLPRGHAGRASDTFRFDRPGREIPWEFEDGCPPPRTRVRESRTQMRPPRTTMREPRTIVRPNGIRNGEKNGDDDGGGGARSSGEAELAVTAGLDPAGQPGLFDVDDAAGLLVERTFEPRDARKLVERFGPERVRQGVAHVDYLARQGRIRKGVRAALVHWLKSGLPQDEGLQAEQAKREREAKRREQAELNAADQAAQAEQAAGDRRLAEAVWRGLSHERKAEVRAQILADLPAASRRLHEKLEPEGRIWRSLILNHLMGKGETP